MMCVFPVDRSIQYKTVDDQRQYIEDLLNDGPRPPSYTQPIPTLDGPNTSIAPGLPGLLSSPPSSVPTVEFDMQKASRINESNRWLSKFYSMIPDSYKRGLSTCGTIPPNQALKLGVDWLQAVLIE
jgi:hypothetical protein